MSSEFPKPFPPGVRFSPKPKEIFDFYLRPAILGEPMPYDVVVQREIYGENMEPWKIFDNKDPKEPSWVFTKLKKKGKRMDRMAGCGCWHGLVSEEVKDEHGQLLGWHKTYIFTCKEKDQPSNQGNDRWSMDEFSLNDENLSDYVICKIKNKGERKPSDRKRKTPEVNGEENNDLTKNKDVAERKKKKRKPPEVSDEEMLTQAQKALRLDDRVASETYQQKFSENLDDQENHHLTWPQNETPVSTINPIEDSLHLQHEFSIDESKGNEQNVDNFLRDLLKDDPCSD